MGEICVMDSSGDVRTIWNPNNTREVENARRTFEDLTSQNYHAFRVLEGGDQGERMDDFDETAGKIIMVPQMVGG